MVLKKSLKVKYTYYKYYADDCKKQDVFKLQIIIKIV